MKIRILLVLGLVGILFSTGCVSKSSVTTASTTTAVTLNKNNYKLLKAGAVGTDHGFKLLGILPFANASVSGARANLYKNLGVPVNGKSVALANTTEDKGTIYLILFSVPKLTVQADVIEYMQLPDVQPPL